MIGSVLVSPSASRILFMRDSIPYLYDFAAETEQRIDVAQDATPQDWMPVNRLVWALPADGGGDGGVGFGIFTTAPDGSDASAVDPPVGNRSTHVRHFRQAFEDRLTYGGSDATFGRQIYTVELDGSELLRLTDDDFQKDNPTPSPDGSSIVYRVVRDNPAITLDMVASTGGEPVPLIAPSDLGEWSAAQVLQVAWSPSGTRLAVEINLGPQESIWLAFPDGESAIQLNSVNPIGPLVWSPDGQTLLIGDGAEIARVDLETGALTDVTTTPQVRERPVAWVQ